MNKKKRKMVIFLVLILIFSFFPLFTDILWVEKNKEIYNISVIIRGKNTESWEIMKQGIDQAALEMNSEIRFITLSEENSVDEQTELINREINNGTDAILISPVDYEKMVEPVEMAMSKVPVVLIESTINSNKNLAYISCNNYEMGVSLAEEVIQNGNTRSEISIIANNLECSSINERYNGFKDTINKTNNTYNLLELYVDEKVAYNKIMSLLEKNTSDVIIAFDAETLEIIGETKKNLNRTNSDIEVYGIGSTSKIISLLEDKIINSIGVQNEFNIGYLGVKNAVNMLRGKKIGNSVIESTIVTMRNMYSNENQRLLFPFIR